MEAPSNSRAVRIERGKQCSSCVILTSTLIRHESSTQTTVDTDMRIQGKNHQSTPHLHDGRIQSSLRITYGVRTLSTIDSNLTAACRNCTINRLPLPESWVMGYWKLVHAMRKVVRNVCKMGMSTINNMHQQLFVVRETGAVLCRVSV